MTSCNPATMSQLELHCPRDLWTELLVALRQRGNTERESGAFLLGSEQNGIKVIKRFVLYDDLDPESLASGYVHIRGRHFAELWRICAEAGLVVVADVHTHPFGACQSLSDRENPMIAVPGHLAIIIPNYAQGRVQFKSIGLYHYRGQHQWDSFSGRQVSKVLKVTKKRSLANL
jgi:proteasome lid subunit RPN8/RPN11